MTNTTDYVDPDVALWRNLTDDAEADPEDVRAFAKAVRDRAAKAIEAQDDPAADAEWADAVRWFASVVRRAPERMPE